MYRPDGLQSSKVFQGSRLFHSLFPIAGGFPDWTLQGLVGRLASERGLTLSSPFVKKVVHGGILPGILEDNVLFKPPFDVQISNSQPASHPAGHPASHPAGHPAGSFQLPGPPQLPGSITRWSGGGGHWSQWRQVDITSTLLLQWSPYRTNHVKTVYSLERLLRWIKSADVEPTSRFNASAAIFYTGSASRFRFSAVLTTILDGSISLPVRRDLTLSYEVF